MKLIAFISATLFLFGGLYLILLAKRFLSFTKGYTIQEYDHPQKALIVIDLQRDLTTRQGKFVINLKQTDKAIENVNRLIDNADRFDMDVIYIRHEVKPNFIVNRLPKIPCLKGTAGAEMDRRIHVVNRNIFVKNRLDAFSDRAFEDYLHGRRIAYLIFTGVDAQFCVDRTLKAALNRGFKTTVVTDAVATKNEERLHKKIEEFKAIGACMTTTEKLLKEP